MRPMTRLIDSLTQVKGIGVWTAAHVFLMFSLRRPNVLPTVITSSSDALTSLRKSSIPTVSLCRQVFQIR